MSNIRKAFENGKAFIPFITCGDPDLETTARAVRAMAEAAGYEVRWDKTLGVVVSREGETVLSAKPGTDTVMTALGEAGLETPCVLEQGVTYLPAADLCYWLNVYFVK